MLEWINAAIVACGKLGALPSATIWALTTLALGYYVYLSKKQEKETQIVWQNIRIEDAKAEMAMADAIKLMVERVKEQGEEIRTLHIKIDERIPHRS